MRYFNFTCSEYLIIFLSMERYIFLCHAHFKHQITYRKTQIYVGCIVVATFFYNLPIWFERTWTKDENGKVIMQNTILRHSSIYTEVYETWMYTVFNLILPLVCLITLNFLILKKVLSTWNLKLCFIHQFKSKIISDQTNKCNPGQSTVIRKWANGQNSKPTYWKKSKKGKWYGTHDDGHCCGLCDLQHLFRNFLDIFQLLFGFKGTVYMLGQLVWISANFEHNVCPNRP